MVTHLIHVVCNVVTKTWGSAASVGALQGSTLVRRYEGMKDLNLSGYQMRDMESSPMAVTRHGERALWDAR